MTIIFIESLNNNILLESYRVKQNKVFPQARDFKQIQRKYTNLPYTQYTVSNTKILYTVYYIGTENCVINPL